MSIFAYRRSWAGINLAEDAAIGKVFFAHLFPAAKGFIQQVRLVFLRNEHIALVALRKSHRRAARTTSTMVEV